MVRDGRAKEQEFLQTYETLEDDAAAHKKEDSSHSHAAGAGHGHAEKDALDEKHGSSAAPVDWKSVQSRLAELDSSQLKALELQAQVCLSHVFSP